MLPPEKSAVLKSDDLVVIRLMNLRGGVQCTQPCRSEDSEIYTGTDKDCKTVIDLLKIVLNPDMTLPTYVAADITRLPLVDVEQMDLFAVLWEITLMR